MRLLIVFFLIGIVPTAFANSLASSEIERIMAVKKILCDVDTKSLNQTTKELAKTGHPETYLCMREAMAKAYADIVREQDVQGQGKKEWLYSKVTLNMAYLQFVGTKQKAKADSDLDVLIRRKLRSYLPQDIDHRPGFRYAMD